MDKKLYTFKFACHKIFVEESEICITNLTEEQAYAMFKQYQAALQSTIIGHVNGVIDTDVMSVAMYSNGVIAMYRQDINIDRLEICI